MRNSVAILFQLCCTYGTSLVDAVWKRNDFLKEKFNFLCDCQGCKNSWVLSKVINILSYNFFLI